jgi:hypothetical protein
MHSRIRSGDRLGKTTTHTRRLSEAPGVRYLSPRIFMLIPWYNNYRLQISI